MKTSIDVIEALREKLGGVSYYRVAKELGVHTSYVNNIRYGKTTLGEASALRAAEILECEPAELVIIGAADRAKMSPLKESYYRLLQRAGVAVMVLCGAGFQSPDAHAGQAMQAHDEASIIYIMRSYRDRRVVGGSSV